MPETPKSLLDEWANFYVIMGSAAAALTGLVFVVITLVAGGRSSSSRDGVAAFSTPTVVKFGIVLLTSTLLNVPWQSLSPLSVIVIVVGLYGSVYTFGVTHRARRQSAYQPDVTDWLFYSAFPLIAYLTYAAAGIALAFVASQALFGLAAAVLLLTFLAIRNAWDVVTYIAVEQPQQAREPDLGDAARVEPASNAASAAAPIADTRSSNAAIDS